MSLLAQYFATYFVGLKEFNSMISAKKTQLRSDRTKMIYQYFHDMVLPAMVSVEPKIFKAIIKSLSQAYRNKNIDVNDVFSQIEPLLKSGGSKPKLTINTKSPSPRKVEAEVPESPSHKISEKKKVQKKVKCEPIKEHLKPRKKIIKKLVKQLTPPSPVNALTETETESETE